MALLTKDIRLEGFDVAFGEKVLLKNADMTLTYGRRYGMVGRNGLGKSTLLRMMSSRQLVLPGIVFYFLSIYFFKQTLLTIEFSAASEHIVTYRFGGSTNHLFSMLCFL